MRLRSASRPPGAENASEDDEVRDERDRGRESQTERESGFAVARDENDRGQHQHRPDRDHDHRHRIDGDVGDRVAAPRLMKDRDVVDRDQRLDHDKDDGGETEERWCSA